MKHKELKALSKEELSKKLNELQKELMKDYTQVATGTIPKNPGKIYNARKTIARINTLLAQKEAVKQA